MPKDHSKPGQVIALTGGGYKGLSLLGWLEQSKQFRKIVFLNHRKSAFPYKKTKFYRLDLTETLADVQLAEILKQEQVDTLVHTAFPITPPRNVARAHELISVGSMYVANAAAEAKIKKLILASTADVYGAFPNNPNYLTEEHAARAGLQSRFLADKIDAEQCFLKLARKHPEMTVTILRPATILGPNIKSYKTQYLSRAVVPTVFGFDPLVQFIHEADLLQGFQKAILQDCPGIYNLASRGVIPLSKAIRLMGKINLPLAMVGIKSFVQLLWYLNVSPAPATHVDYLKYPAVVSTERAEAKMGFSPKYSCKRALLDFIGAEFLRSAATNRNKEAP